MNSPNEFVAFLFAAAQDLDVHRASLILSDDHETLKMYQRIADAAEDFIETHQPVALLTMEEHDARVSVIIKEATAPYKERVKRLEQGIVNLTLMMADKAAKVLEPVGEASCTQPDKILLDANVQEK